MKKTIEELDITICEQLGERYTACYDNPDNDGTYRVDVLELDEDDARDIIEEAGYEILDVVAFNGSDWDGISFIIK